jgi:hypothetical protein
MAQITNSFPFEFYDRPSKFTWPMMATCISAWTFEAAQELRRKVDILNGHPYEALSRLGLVIGDLDNRLAAVETKIIGEETINSQQAKQIQDLAHSAVPSSRISKMSMSRTTTFAQSFGENHATQPKDGNQLCFTNSILPRKNSCLKLRAFLLPA